MWLFFDDVCKEKNKVNVNKINLFCLHDGRDLAFWCIVINTAETHPFQHKFPVYHDVLILDDGVFCFPRLIFQSYSVK